MLALRSMLVVAGGDAEALARATRSSADAVVVDLASPSLHLERARVRTEVARAIEAIGAAGRVTVARVASAISGELELDLEASVGPHLAAVMLGGAEAPQDARDADVALRKFEVRHAMTPGAVRLIPEVDSATGLQALPGILDAVDRHAAVALNAARLHEDLGLGHDVQHAHDHAMAQVAIAARAAELPWVLASFDGDRGLVPATRAHEFGAVGVAVRSDAAARGMNSLFAPEPAAVATARAVVARWELMHGRGELVAVTEGGNAGEPMLVDRRTVRRARMLLARAEAIAARERVRD